MFWLHVNVTFVTYTHTLLFTSGWYISAAIMKVCCCDSRVTVHHALLKTSMGIYDQNKKSLSYSLIAIWGHQSLHKYKYSNSLWSVCTNVNTQRPQFCNNVDCIRATKAGGFISGLNYNIASKPRSLDDGAWTIMGRETDSVEINWHHVCNTSSHIYWEPFINNSYQLCYVKCSSVQESLPIRYISILERGLIKL